MDTRSLDYSSYRWGRQGDFGFGVLGFRVEGWDSVSRVLFSPLGFSNYVLGEKMFAAPC